MANQPTSDTELSAIAADILKLDPDGRRTAKVVRETFDQIYDGQRTGRYRWDQLYKTEKTHFGTLVEINLCREFAFQDGIVLDYLISGAEVDCKYSQTLGGWMIPPEARGKICLVLWAEDNANPKWSMGLVRATEDRLNTGNNRDAKATLNRAGRDAIIWLFEGIPLPPNVLLQLDASTVERVMSQKSGRKRINELFRSALGRIVGRAVVATVAQQDDYMKRIRENGGARTDLKPEGIIILGQYESHVAIARALGIHLPGSGESISAWIVPTSSREPGTAEIGNQFWKIGTPGDKVVAAPRLPKIKRTSARKA